MPQNSVWETEYTNPKLMTGSNEPSNDFKRFVKWLRKDRKLSLEGLRVLDLGSGLGKNAIFLAERGAKVVGLEVSETAIVQAKHRAEENGVILNLIQDPERSTSLILDSGSEPGMTPSGGAFLHHDIGTPYPFADRTFDLVLDVISSNSLDEKGRKVYLKEVQRVLKSGGYFFVRALCKDGDKNAEKLLEKNPGKEQDTYIIPEWGLTERVFGKTDFEQLYKEYFSILYLTKKSGYAKFAEKTYKRNYWLAYLQKT